MMKRSPNKLTPADVRAIVRKRRHGASYAALGREYGVSLQAIHYRLRTSRARLLDEDGKLHELTGHRLPDKIRAVVWLREKEPISPRVHTTADRAGGREGSAAEGTSAAAAMRVHAPANVDQQHQDPERKPASKPPEPRPMAKAVEPVSRPAAGRSAAATADYMAVTAGETARCAPPVRTRPAGRIDRVGAPTVFDQAEAQRAEAERHALFGRDAASSFSATSPYVRARAPADIAQYRAALAAREPKSPAMAPPIERAISREECIYCGVPGFRGCAHQLPYEAPGPETEPFDYRAAYRPVYGQEAVRREANQKQSA